VARALVLRADARHLPLSSGSVDLIVTSPPYWGQRSYEDDGKPLEGQIGSEATPAEWLAVMLECTAEWMRVLKPEGSIFVNLGDKYDSGTTAPRTNPGTVKDGKGQGWHQGSSRVSLGQPKSLLGLPWRYAIGCVDDLGLILRQDCIDDEDGGAYVWEKANGLPESAADRCRRAHEYVFHLVKQPRYYSAVDEIREPLAEKSLTHRGGGESWGNGRNPDNNWGNAKVRRPDPRGAAPGSVWKIASEPLNLPDWLGVEHFACVDAETEILTTRGWLRHDQLAEGDQVAGYDLDGDMARWTGISAVSRYDYDGELIAVESRDLSMRLTPNHRTIVQRMHTRAKRRSPVSVVRADQLDRYHFIPRAAAWEPYADARHIHDGMAALIGWIAAEGWYQNRGVWLSQSLEVNGPHVAEIDKLIPDAARTERKRVYKGRPWTEVTWKLGQAGGFIQRAMPDKLLPWWLVTANTSARSAVLDAFIAGDGHRRPDGRVSITQKLRHNLDVLQAIAVTLGYKTTIREGGGRFVLYLTEGGRSVTLRGTSGVGSKVRRQYYKGIVWCPTTGTGTFIARRNGTVFVTGNSFPMALPRKIILGWSPPGICTACGEGRRPVVDKRYVKGQSGTSGFKKDGKEPLGRLNGTGMAGKPAMDVQATIAGYACACTPYTDHPGQHLGVAARTGPRGAVDPGNAPRQASGNLGTQPRNGPWREYHFDRWTPPPTRPAVVVDPFGGVGTTALVAVAHGRHGISFDLGADYSRAARWRTGDSSERAKARGEDRPPPAKRLREDLYGGLTDEWDALLEESL
jgi:DNA methylase